MLRLLLITVFNLAALGLLAQEKPQSSKPGPSPERQIEIRDSIRAIGKTKFVEKVSEEDSEVMNYRPDRALLMPKMERTAIFRIGIPRFLIRLGLRAGRNDFDDQQEYMAVRALTKRIRSIRLAAFAKTQDYDHKELVRDYEKFVKRKKQETVMMVRAPEGGVQIHVKVRRKKVKRVSLIAYGEDGAAVIRLKGKIREKDLRLALNLMSDAAEESSGLRINTGLEED